MHTQEQRWMDTIRNTEIRKVVVENKQLQWMDGTLNKNAGRQT